MNVNEYLAIRNNPTQDTMPVLFFYYNLRFPNLLNYSDFVYYITLWISHVSMHRIGHMNYRAFVFLDKYFAVN